MMKEKIWIPIVLIVVVGICLFSIFNEMNALRNQVVMLQGDLHSLRSLISQETRVIQEAVQMIQEDNRWWHPGDIDFIEAEDETSQIRINWFIKEYQEGSQVNMHYRLSGEEDFIVMSVEGEDGYFSADVPLKLPKGPVWSTYVERRISVDSWRNNERGDSRIDIVEEEIKDSKEYYELHYFFSMKHGDTVKNSEMRALELTQFQARKYGSVRLEIIYHGAEEVELVFYQYHSGEKQDAVEEVFLESRTHDGGRLKKWPLNPPQSTEARPGYEEMPEGKVYMARVNPGEDYGTLNLVVQFEDGLTVEREL